MTNFNTIENAANKAAVIQANFELLDLMLSTLLGVIQNARVIDGCLQIKDATAAADVENTTHHWRKINGDDGAIGLGDTLLINSGVGILDGILAPLLAGVGNARIRNGALQIKDATAVADEANTTHHWREFSGDDGVAALGDTLLANALTTTLAAILAGTGNVRIKNGVLQIKDRTAADDPENTTHHWREITGAGGALGLGETLLSNA